MIFSVRFFRCFFILLFLAGISYSVNAQAKIDENKRKVFNEFYHNYQVNHKNWEKNGSKMLENSQSNYERGISYLTLGQGKYEKGDYVKSVELLEKAQKDATSVDSLYLQADIYMVLIPAYRRAGLISQSNDGLEKLKKITKKLNAENSNFYLFYCEAKIYDIDKKFCEAAEKRREFAKNLKDVSQDKDVNNRYRFSVLNQLCYVELKCGDIENARKTFADVEKLLSNIDRSNPVKLIEFFYMNKALLYAHDNEKKLALQNFEKATNEALSTGNNIVIKELLSERLKTNLDTPEDQLKFTKKVQEISDSETTISKNLVYIEAIKNKKDLLAETKRTELFIGIAVFLVILLLIGLVFYKIRNKQLRVKYSKIIEELERPSNKNDVSPSLDFNDNDSISSDIIKNNSTEQEILRNLELFEKKKLFTTKGISTAQMAVMLKTNTKYLNHILKKYRNSDFHNYINDRRIDFIVRELHDNPQLLQYKIAVLSDMCGYSSHSQFTSIFKSRKEISPSQYIDFLQKDQF